MKPEAADLRTKVEQLKKQLSEAEEGLEGLVRTCQHKFSETVYNPIYTPAYTSPGDPPGTMGVDWQGPVYVESKTEDRWSRTCNSCGEKQYTTQVKKEIKKIPAWPGDRV